MNVAISIDTRLHGSPSVTVPTEPNKTVGARKEFRYFFVVDSSRLLSILEKI